MYNTTVGGVTLKVNLATSVQERLEKSGVDIQKIYEQVESISDKIVSSKSSEKFFVMDDEVGIGCELAVDWVSEKDVVVNIVLVIGLDKVFVKKGIMVKKVRNEPV